MLAQCLCSAAVRAGHSVLLTRADALFKELLQARADHTFDKVFRRFLAPFAGDMIMLAVASGRERTHDEFAAMLLAADLKLVSATPTTTPVWVLEGAHAEQNCGTQRHPNTTLVAPVSFWRTRVLCSRTAVSVSWRHDAAYHRCTGRCVTSG